MWVLQSFYKMQLQSSYLCVHRFQQAWINYIALQDIPYESAFQCGCGTHQCDYVIADGILLGVHKDKVMRCSSMVPRQP